MSMYSREERLKAIELYIRYERSAAAVIHDLGYPDPRMLAKLFILVYSDQRSCAIRPAIPKVSGHRSRSIRPSFLSIRPTAGTSRLECTMN